MVRPEHNLRLVQQLVATRPPPQTLRIELAQPQHVDRPLDTQVVHLTLHVHGVQVLVRQVVQHQAVDLGLDENVLVLGQADVVEPLGHPHAVDEVGVVQLQPSQMGGAVEGLQEECEPLAVQQVLNACHKGKVNDK